MDERESHGLSISQLEYSSTLQLRKCKCEYILNMHFLWPPQSSSLERAYDTYTKQNQFRNTERIRKRAGERDENQKNDLYCT